MMANLSIKNKCVGRIFLQSEQAKFVAEQLSKKLLSVIHWNMSYFEEILFLLQKQPPEVFRKSYS